MRGLLNMAGSVFMALAAVSCSDEVVTAAGVPQELAIARAAQISELHYRLHFDIPADQQVGIKASAAITFDLAANDASLALDFRQPASAVSSLRINGESTDVKLQHEHIRLPTAALRVGTNEIEVEFTAGDSSLNRNPEFLYTLFVPDRARTAFPLFDQPDLKARFELSLEVPAGWQALANAPLLQRHKRGEGRREYQFAPTELISSYLFSFVAGEFQSISRNVAGRRMTMLHRETDEGKVARNIDAIFELHGQSIAWMEQYTGIAYPFQKFDFVAIPGFPFNGMEHVGAIQYRATSLFLNAEPPLTEVLGRAQLIAHETAHMWFGNLVTMQWFDDVWTKEVFANFMADKIVNPAFGEVDHQLNFLVNHYPAAYAVDRSEGANPIRQPLANLNQAGSLYGSIIYHKAPIMMRQLELIVGEQGLRDGLAEYLRQFSFGNATWPALIAILDKRTAVDLAAWSQVWVNTAGRPEFQLLATAAGDAPTNRLLQLDPLGLDRVWPQQFEVLQLGADSRQLAAIRADSRELSLPALAGGESPVATVFNANGQGYGLFPATVEQLSQWDRLSPVQKGVALLGVYDNLLAGALDDLPQYYAMLLGIVQQEPDPLLLTLALEQLWYVYEVLLDDAQRGVWKPLTEEALWLTTLAQPDSSRTKLLFRFYAEMASSAEQVQRLYDIWLGTLVVDKLTLEEEDREALSQTLAIRLPAKSDAIIAQQLAGMTNPDRRRRLEFIAPSLSGDEAVRDDFFASLKREQQRQTESWVIDALRKLHHPSRLQQSEKYLLPSLELLQELQVTGDIFFPANWLQASLGNHHSTEAAQTVRRFLAQRPDYNPQLRMKILQAADGVFRAAKIRARATRPADT